MTACRQCALPELKRTTCSETKATSSTARRNIFPAAVTSHNMRPRPGRRRRQRAEPLTIFLVIFITILSLSTVCTPTGAIEIPAQFRRGPQFARLARKGEILLDRRPFTHVAVQPRQSGDLFDTGTTTSTESSSTSSGSSSTASSSLRDISTYSTTATPLPSTATAPPTSSGSSTASVVTAPASTDVQLPRPFDTSLGSNFTSSDCPNFFNSFLNNSTFTSCLPLSLLLQNSNSFFTASKSLPAITATLNATCNVVFPTCSSLMSSLATQIKQDSTCGPDYRAQNPLVLQAYNGLLAYPPLYKAGCLQASSPLLLLLQHLPPARILPRQRHHQRLLPLRLLHLLPAPRPLPPRRRPPLLLRLPQRHHGRFSAGGQGCGPAGCRHVCGRRSADRFGLWAGVC
ncbi:MAG: hypothetical protein FRX48_00936 [Lasallia pustulata]|uniref:DUF7729 domain-containing protein n=1 Tax=Lasallia pustulata TaxID=136370 RepID=A0A5M8Q1Z4_9LECA|nr:MAG: hypothetical protein FRX48_00936 [Lasallia pustulata]